MKVKKNKYQYKWIDDFIKNIKPYVHVRLEDNLLIKKPNKATKLNKQGAQILKYLLEGGKIKSLLNKAGESQQKEIIYFIVAVKNYLKGDLDEFTNNPAVDIQPFDMKFSSYPVLSELAITYRCNLKCRFCYAGCNCTSNPINKNEELGIESLKKIIYKIYYEAKVPSISFTGGEPTLRKNELPELIKYAKKLNMRVNLISNGTLINENYARILEKAGLDTAQISLEGITANTHDEIVGVHGAYEKTLNAIEILKKSNISVHTNTTITSRNINECINFPQFVKNTLGLDKFSMNLIIPTGSSIIYNDLIIKYSEIGDVLLKIIENSNIHGIEFMWYSPVPMCMFNSILHGLGNKGCSACDGLVSVSPAGDILPCASFDDLLGNILDRDFETIWNNTKCTNYRNKNFAHDYCKSCEEFPMCNGACPLYWRYCGYDELNQTINKINNDKLVSI
ncbi:MAG: hypothetical protein Kow0068_20000 [Marinilabiliales bacterium]